MGVSNAQVLSALRAYVDVDAVVFSHSSVLRNAPTQVLHEDSDSLGCADNGSEMGI